MAEERTRAAVAACAHWLAACIRLGWRHEDLDWLEELWWKHRNHRGELLSDLKHEKQESGYGHGV